MQFLRYDLRKSLFYAIEQHMDQNRFVYSFFHLILSKKQFSIKSDKKTNIIDVEKREDTSYKWIKSTHRKIVVFIFVSIDLKMKTIIIRFTFTYARRYISNKIHSFGLYSFAVEIGARLALFWLIIYSVTASLLYISIHKTHEWIIPWLLAWTMCVKMRVSHQMIYVLIFAFFSNKQIQH